MHSFQVVGRFAIHVLVGVAIFALIAGATILLHELTALLGSRHVHPYIVAGMQAVETLLFAVDLFCFCCFILKEEYVFVRGLLRES